MKYGGQQLGRGTNDCMWNALCSSLSVGSVARMFFASRSIVSLPYLRRWGCFSIFLVLISPRQPQQPSSGRTLHEGTRTRVCPLSINFQPRTYHLCHHCLSSVNWVLAFARVIAEYIIFDIDIRGNVLILSYIIFVILCNKVSILFFSKRLMKKWLNLMLMTRSFKRFYFQGNNI